MEEQDYILIEQYLQGDLTAAQRADFEARLAAEPTLADAFAERRLLNAHLQAAGQEEALRGTLEQLGNKHFSVPEAKVRTLGGNRRWLYGVAVAAVIALAVLLGGPWLFPGGNNYEQFAQHAPLSLTERGASPQLAAQAEATFNAGQFRAAVPLLQEYLTVQADDERAQLALGISLLETDKDEEAIVIFERIAEGNSSLAPYGNWYLALAAVKRGDDANAIKYLDLIPATDTYLTTKAQELRATL